MKKFTPDERRDIGAFFLFALDCALGDKAAIMLLLDEQTKRRFRLGAEAIDAYLKLIDKISADRAKAGSVTSQAKTLSSRRNGKLGGVPDTETARANGLQGGRPTSTGTGVARNCQQCGKRHAKKYPCGAKASNWEAKTAKLAEQPGRKPWDGKRKK